MIYYTKKRYIVYVLMAILFFSLPFLHIDGNHFFLLSFDRKELHLLFTRFDMQEMYLMPFILITLFLSIFFITTLAGRVWCGWSCPQTIFRVVFRDVIQTKLLKIRKSTANKQSKPKLNLVKQIIAIFIFACCALIIASNFMLYFISPEDFFIYIKNPSEHAILFGIIFFLTLFLIFDIVFLQERFCVYVCPYARIQSVMFDNDTIQVIYDEKRGGVVYKGKEKISNKPLEEGAECIGCNACVHICPTHIDIRKGMQLECINCLECSDACAKIMDKFGKKSLINWTSKNAIESGNKVKYLRFRTIGYIVVISIVLCVLAFMSTKKENMLLNINRTTELYNIHLNDENVRVDNAYTFFIQNTSNKNHEYYFDVKDSRISISRPRESIDIKAGSKRKIIVVLSTDQKLSNDHRSDTPFDILINAYAIDDRNISVDRKTIFVYPKQEVILDKMKK